MKMMYAAGIFCFEVSIMYIYMLLSKVCRAYGAISSFNYMFNADICFGVSIMYIYMLLNKVCCCAYGAISSLNYRERKEYI